MRSAGNCCSSRPQARRPVGGEPETGRQLLGGGEVFRQACGQVDALQADDALVTLALGRFDGDRQHAFGHQLAQGRVRRDLLGVVTGNTAHLAVAGAFDHQQRHRSVGARLQRQQAVELQRADQQRRGGQQLTEQLSDRFRVGVFGQHVLVAFGERGGFAAHVVVVEEKALGLVGHAGCSQGGRRKVVHFTRSVGTPRHPPSIRWTGRGVGRSLPLSP